MRWDLVNAWLARAEHDALAARAILAADMPTYEAASFHSQQAAEKALKALLTRLQISFTKTHDLGELLRLADPAAPGIAERFADVDRLNRHAVDSRYPAPAPPVGRDDAARDLALATGVLNGIKDLLKPYLDAGRP